MSTDNHEPSRPPPGPRPSGSGRLGLVLAMALGLVAGLVGGAHWHRRLHGWFGLGGARDGDANASAEKQLWTCGMHPEVIRDQPGNCPKCGMALEPVKSSAAAGTGAAAAERKIKYWWDPMMSPPYIRLQPGKSPMGMDLVPVYDDEVSGGTKIAIDPVVVQNMGVRVAQVTLGPLRKSIRAVGILEQPQPGIHDVNMRISGWIEKLHADTDGMFVKQGQPLFELYSPEAQVGTEELIVARKAADSLPAGADASRRQMADALLHAAHRKLEQWGLQREQIEELARLDRAPRTVPFLSPATGEVAEKMVVEGSMVKMGERALQILDRSTLWLDTQVHAQDVPFLRLGQAVAAQIEAFPGREFDGVVVFIHPRVDPMTRTTTVRMALPNPQLALRPGTYATARIEALLAEEALLAPREAVLDTGNRQVVFVSLPQGHFEPRKVTLGSAGEDGLVQVLTGLAPGETVVVSGQFLMDAESRMEEARQKFLSEKLLGKGAPSSSPAQAASGPARPASAPAATRAAGSPQWHGDVDSTVAAYLTLAKALGAVQTEDKPLDVADLRRAAAALRQHAQGPAQQALAEQVLGAAGPMAKEPLARQRELFKRLSDAVIALAESSPPSRQVGDRLYLLYCPMFPGQWLQSDSRSANPYYATDMKDCAELKRILYTRE